MNKTQQDDLFQEIAKEEFPDVNHTSSKKTS